MSLINDALKRASQSTTAPAPAPPTTVKPEATLRPIEHKKATPWPLVIVSVLLVISIGIGGWLFFRNPTGMNASGSSEDRTHAQARQPAAAPDPVPLAAVQSAPASPQHTSEQPRTTSTTRPATSGTEAPSALAAASSPSPTLQTAVSAVSAPPVAAPMPMYKLQGIFYRPDHPMAMINGRNVVQGDKVSDAKVVSIGRESVTLSVDGQTKVLTLSQNN
jgi:hypothetical protein